MTRLNLSVLVVLMLVCTHLSPISPVAAQMSLPASVITTKGYGLASVPAERMVLQLVVMPDDHYGVPITPPVGSATPDARVSTDPIIAAIGGMEGVASVETIVFIPLGSAGRPASTVRLDVAISQPTKDRVVAIVNTAADAAGGERVMIGYIGAWFGITDCVALETQARQMALDDAIANAAIQADVMGVGLGEAVSATDVTTTETPEAAYYSWMSSAANSCSPPQLSQSLTEFGVISPIFDPATQEPNVEVLHTVEVTFAIARS